MFSTLEKGIFFFKQNGQQKKEIGGNGAEEDETTHCQQKTRCPHTHTHKRQKLEEENTFTKTA